MKMIFHLHQYQIFFERNHYLCVYIWRPRGHILTAILCLKVKKMASDDRKHHFGSKYITAFWFSIMLITFLDMKVEIVLNSTEYCSIRFMIPKVVEMPLQMSFWVFIRFTRYNFYWFLIRRQ